MIGTWGGNSFETSDSLRGWCLFALTGASEAVTKLVGADAVRKAVADSVPAAVRALNFEAFEKGFEYGVNVLAAVASRAELEALAVAEE
jgi:hypothetical protein